MKGMELCRRFYEECVGGVLALNYPKLRYSAGLLGFGSDVLGYDDEVSQDHMWGPRLYIFIAQNERISSTELLDALSRNLPRSFMGYPVGFGAADEHGISAMGSDDGVFRPMINICTFADFLSENLGIADVDNLTAAHWLAFSEHKLLSLKKGQLFRDDLNIADILKKLDYYPRDVWLYMLMSDWSCLAEERAFVKRTAACGDEIGSRIVCARLAHRIMHLCFLYERRYAPYSKWFGVAFGELKCAGRVKPVLQKALATDSILEREELIARAQSLLIEMHNACEITPPISAALHPYYTRDITVADADLVYEALVDLLSATQLRDVPPIGALSNVGNLVVLTEDPANLERIMRLYI